MDELAIRGPAALPRPAAIPRPVMRAAQQLEGAFAAELMKAARPPERQGMFSGGIGASSFDSFMDQALGDAMAQRGNLGLANHIARSMLGAQARQAAGTEETP